MRNQENKAFLLLEDGSVYQGKAMGSQGKAMGIAVFNTAMVGYQELLTNPANRGLLLTQTFPLTGNYGMNRDGWESGRAQAAGFIVREYCTLPSNYKCEGTIDDFLKEQGVVGICDIDTRHLTKTIREKGEMKAVIFSGGELDRETLLAELKGWNPEKPTASAEKEIWGETGIPVAVLDFGMSRSMKEILLNHGMKLTVLPWNADAEEIKALSPAGIFLSDGPGSPEDYPGAPEKIRELIALNLPMMGVSLGHQLLALANGMKVRRMLCGHRGGNQPVFCSENGRTYITSQNHGWVVDEESADSAMCSVTFRNANDKTIEGLSYRNVPALSVQFLPDGENHNHTTAFLYEEFRKRMEAAQ